MGDLNILRSAKSLLEKLMLQGADMGPKLKNMASMDSLYEVKLQEYETCMKSLNDYLNELREHLTTMEDKEDLSGHSRDIKLHIEKAHAHSDGIKSLMKRLKALMAA